MTQNRKYVRTVQSVLATGNGLENHDVISRFLDAFMASRCTTLPFLYRFIFINIKPPHFFRSIWPVRDGTPGMEH
jgi:hypothetical protein